MRKFKMLSLSLITAFTFSVPTTLLSVQASENLEQEIAPVADTIFVSRTLTTYTTALWVTESRNGKTYSGYIYYNGKIDIYGRYILEGYISAGPHVEPYVLEFD
ncbi:hypothetical protein MHH70_07465 [Metasolibacillus sp. FSL H7-0170]|uniref:hypothetical protein n=1 Tax=Metasolibacillus sp. FSL H7-0170 TaxID=2921431 RepID=UPI003158E368